MPNLNEYLRRRRLAIAVTQEEVARRLTTGGYPISKASITHWEAGRYNPPMDDPQFVLCLIEALEDEPLHFFAETGYFGENEIAKFLRRVRPEDRDFLRSLLTLLTNPSQQEGNNTD